MLLNIYTYLYIYTFIRIPSGYLNCITFCTLGVVMPPLKFNQNAIVYAPRSGSSHLNNSDKPFWTRRYYAVAQENPVSPLRAPYLRTLIIYPRATLAGLDELLTTAGPGSAFRFQSLRVLTGCRIYMA